MKKGKKAMELYEVLIHLILIGLLFAVFFGSSIGNVNSRNVRQQVLEKQLALLIDSAIPGTTLTVSKVNFKGNVDRIEVKEGSVFAYVEGLAVSKGYQYFTKYSVAITQDQNKIYIKIT